MVRLPLHVGPWCDVNMRTAFCSAAEQEATYCLHSPGGAELLELVGYVYVQVFPTEVPLNGLSLTARFQEAKQHQGRYLGLPAFWHTVSVASVTTRRNYFRCQRRLTACVQICQRWSTCFFLNCWRITNLSASTFLSLCWAHNVLSNAV